MVERAGVEAKLGFPAHPHMLRHACGFALANKGHDTRALQAYLGHRNIPPRSPSTSPATSSTRCDTPSCRRAGSRTSGDDGHGRARYWLNPVEGPLAGSGRGDNGWGGKFACAVGLQCPHISKLGTAEPEARCNSCHDVPARNCNPLENKAGAIVPSIVQRPILLAARTGCRHCSRARSARAGFSVSIRRRHCAHRLRRNCRRDG